jgi:hypothetical protein
LDEPVFEGGLPARITPADFRRYHLQTFPKLRDVKYDAEIQQAINSVYTMFSGVSSLWERQGKQGWYEKTRTCYRLLVAWFMADMYPQFVSGMPVMGGLPLKQKKIGSVSLTFQDLKNGGSGYHDLLGGLESNPFGKMAKIMISSAAARFRTWNSLWV